MNNENFINNSNIVCPKCGTNNMANTKFCINCGNPFQMENLNRVVDNNLTIPQSNPENIPSNVVIQETSSSQQYNYQNNMDVAATLNSPNQVSTTSMNYFKYILNAFLRPYDSFKKEENNLSKLNNSLILSGIIVAAITILSLISLMITSVRVTSLFTDEVQWVWENLKNINYFKMIIEGLLRNAGILFAVSGVYFLAGLVIKKEVSFVKILSAVVTAFIPLGVVLSILSPIILFIYPALQTYVSVVCFIYTVIILLEFMNDLIKIENKDNKIYFHATSLSILIIGFLFIMGKLISSLF